MRMLMPRHHISRWKHLERESRDEAVVNEVCCRQVWLVGSKTARYRFCKIAAMKDIVTTLQWIAGKRFVATTGSDHSVVIDVPQEWGGTNTAPFNAELVLAALGGCAGMDVVSILGKKRCVWDRLQMSTEAKLSDDRPTGLRDYVLTCRVWGSRVTKQDLEEALTLSLDKYCIVAHSLKGEIRRVAFLNDEQI
jgi:putative redox protein